MSTPSPYYPHPDFRPQPPKNAAGVAALVLGIIGLAFSFIPIVGFFFAVPLGILGVIFGIVGLIIANRRAGVNRGKSITGLSLAAPAIVLAFVITFSVASNSGDDDFEDSHGAVQAAAPSTPDTEKAPSKRSAPKPAPATRKAESFPGQTEGDIAVRPGESLTYEGVTVTATALKVESDDFGRYLCSKVTYDNKGDEQGSYNEIDWNLQDPEGVIDTMSSWTSGDSLGSGDLAPGGKKSGRICFDIEKAKPKGQYVLLLAGFLGFSNERGAWVNEL